mmetsp:Transcript_24938/g.52431  ORF Transcript_24938/g.52431 Transcript_24938/m.52431 type:complete len:367 (+) Transcript_24938:268-1368(+)
MIQRHLLSFVPLASISSSHWDLTTVRSSTLFFVGNNRREFPSITGLSLENGDSTINNVSTHIHSQETTDNDQDESRTQQTQTSIKTNNTNRNKTKKPPTTRTKYARKKSRIRYHQRKKQDPILSNSIDSFLAGEYAHPFSPDAPAPHPGLEPGETVEVSLRALRNLNDPHPSHGAAVFMRFCMPLTRGERWGSGIPLPSGDRGRSSNISHSGNDGRWKRERMDQQWPGHDQWKDLLRGALTPSMLARKLRSSTHFSGLLDWTSFDVTEGASNPNPSMYFISGSSDNIAYVNAALFFGKGLAPTILHFVLKKVGAAWFVDTVLLGSENEEDWLVNYDDRDDEGCDDDGTRFLDSNVGDGGGGFMGLL